MTKLSVTLWFSLPLVSAFSPLGVRLQHLVSRYIRDDPVNDYMNLMCLPLWTNDTRLELLNMTHGQDSIYSLSNSPFPCEQEIYIYAACRANGTTTADFLAEQECLCPSSYWENSILCAQCSLAHGLIQADNITEVVASIESNLRNLECATSPPNQPFANFAPSFNSTEWNARQPLTMSSDPYANNTAVSCYATSTPGVVLGSITGSALARQTVMPAYVNMASFTPTATVKGVSTTWANVGFTDAVSASGSSGSSSSASTSKAGAAEVVVREMKVTSVVAVVMVGLLMVV